MASNTKMFMLINSVLDVLKPDRRVAVRHTLTVDMEDLEALL